MDFPSPPFQWASERDMTGTYGLDKVTCRSVTFGGSAGRPLGDLRAWERILRLIVEL